jgi:hypothetical protein
MQTDIPLHPDEDLVDVVAVGGLEWTIYENEERGTAWANATDNGITYAITAAASTS